MYVFLVCENSLGSNKYSYFHIHNSHICERKYVKIDYAKRNIRGTVPGSSNVLKAAAS